MKKRVNISIEEDVLDGIDKDRKFWGFNRSLFIAFMYKIYCKNDSGALLNEALNQLMKEETK